MHLRTQYSAAKKINVKAKCPYCEGEHIVRMQKQPTIKPRIFCQKTICLHRRAEGV